MKKPNHMPEPDLQAAVTEARRKRAKACSDELDVLLKRHSCRLVAAPVAQRHPDGNLIVGAAVQVVALDIDKDI